MFDAIRNKFAAHMRRLLPGRVVRRFVRQQDGAAAVEFALVAAPFLALTFAILETAFVFFAGQTLEAAVADSARLIMTGQAQGYSQQNFKDQVCARLLGGVFDCAKIYVSVQSYGYPSFSSVSTAPPVTNGVLNTANLPFSQGSPGCIVIVSLYYQWPIYVSMFSNNLSNLNGGNRLLMATSVFRNEPYGPAGSC